MTILVGLGSNLGDRLATLSRSIQELRARDIAVAARSAVYETSPVGLRSPNAFLNAVVEVETERSPRALLEQLLEVEQHLGRRRGTSPGDRTCDLDLLLYGDCCLDEPDLVLPHPRMTCRRFVLLPLLDVAPGQRDPRTGQAFADLAQQLAGDTQQACERVREPEQW